VRVEIGDTEKERRHRKLWKRKPSVDMATLGQFPQVNSSRPGDAVHAKCRAQPIEFSALNTDIFGTCHLKC
jgi:hypothetical protein